MGCVVLGMVRRAARACALAGLAGTSLRAQDPRPTLGQLAHRAWTVRDGAPAGVLALAQADDGFLWMGTTTGLYRFDGVQFEAFAPRAGESLPSLSVNALLALPDGSLWVGYSRGGASRLAGGHVVSYGERDGLPAGTVTAFARDSAGGLWAATTTGIARLVDRSWRRVGAERGLPGGMTADLMVDRRGTLWVAEASGVYVLRRGARRFVRHAPSLDGGSGGSGAAREAPDGSVWGASATRGIVPLADTAGGPLRGAGYRVRDVVGLQVDRRANAWVTGTSGRLVRIPLAAASGGTARTAAAPGQTLSLSRAAGRSGSHAISVLEDREGSVWVGTEGGLDQFRATKFTPVVWPRPVLAPAIAPGDGGAVWAGSIRAPAVAIGRRAVLHPEVPAHITCAHRDLEGGVWLGGPAGLWYARGGPFARVTLPSEAVGSDVQAIARGRDGALWLSVRGDAYRGVLRRRGDVWERFPVVPGPPGDYAMATAADSAGRLWLGYLRDRLALVAADSVRVFSAADGLQVGDVTAVHVRGDRVWVGGETGVMALDATSGGVGRRPRFRPLATAGGALRGVTGIVETADGDLWLNGADGVAHIPAAEWRHVMRDPAYRARDERFDVRDGVNGPAPQIRQFPSAIAGTDGRLWFSTESDVTWVDPARIRKNTRSPPVHIRALDAGGRRYPPVGPIALPPRTTALSVAYTALSLAVPDRVRFRYQLVGVDTVWQDAGGRREAFYTNLGPGSYRFRVVAANDDGVWNTAGAALDVVIPPTFVQTNAFRALCVAAAAAAVYALVLWRHRQVARALNARYHATLAERLRVARELHDTLLTDLAGMTMRLDAATRAPPRDGGDAALLADLRDRARRTLSDTRRAVGAMRASSADLVPLWAQLADAARRVFAGTGVEARVEYTGHPWAYLPAVEAEALGIATEAMENARKHADCRTVAVTCAYTRRELRLRVRDDGRGFDPALAGSNGHYGLAGMRERTAAVGARLTVHSAPGRGTEVRLVVRRPDTGRHA